MTSSPDLLARLEPDRVWWWTRLALATGFGAALLLTFFVLWEAPEFLVALPPLFAAGIAARALVRRPVLHLGLVIAGFVVVADAGEGITAQEVAYGLFYLSYLGGWLAWHVLLCRDHIFRSATDRLLLGFLLFATASFLLAFPMGSKLSTAFSEWLPLTFLALYFPLKEACRRDPRALPALLLAFAFVALVAVARNLWVYYHDLHSAEAVWQIMTGRERLNERFFLIGSIGMLTLFLYTGHRLGRWLLLGGATLLLAGVVVSLSRATWVAYALSLGVVFLMTERVRRRRLVVVTTTGAVAALLVGLLVLDDFFVLVLGGLTDRFASLSGATTRDLSLVNRFIEWEKAWERIRANPLVGYGFAYPYRYYSLVYEFTAVKSHIHSTYVSLLYRHGLVGFGLFMAFFATGARSAWRLARLSAAAPLHRAVAVACLASMAALALAMTTESLLLNDEGTFAFALLCGLPAGLWQYYRTRISRAAAPPDSRPAPPPDAHS